MRQLMERLEAYGVPRRIVSFVVPVGYTFNLDGAAIFLGVATIFIVQLYGIDLSVTYPDGLAKYTAAFFKMSRSSVMRFNSAFSRRISSD